LAINEARTTSRWKEERPEVFKDGEGELVMDLEPMRRSRHDVAMFQHMDTFALCGCNNLQISVNGEVIADEIAVETYVGGGPPVNELLHNTLEQIS